MEDLRKAVIADCEETLANPKNAFTEESMKDKCACYNNLKVVLRVLKTDRSNVEHWFSNVEQHILGKGCKHVWTKARMNEAAWSIAEARRP
jgi:hypothetical protein